jgi:plasmid maintenance system antidote protein VapI
MSDSDYKSAKHGWIRDLLRDHDLTQNDLAEAWECTPAVVSRFINAGVPDITFARAIVLSKLVKLSLDDLAQKINPKPRIRW